jgi:RimJ/RimL family protein N-acetyltransferase
MCRPFAAYRSDPDVARYQSWDSMCSPADAERLVASQQGVAFGRRGAWVQLAAVDRVSGALCGDRAVRVASDQPLTAEVGVTFAPAKQRSGLATEALGAVATRSFEQHGVHRVYAQADDRNLAVHRLLERLGFPVRGTPGRSRLVQSQVGHAAHLRDLAPRMESVAIGRRPSAGEGRSPIARGTVA